MKRLPGLVLGAALLVVPAAAQAACPHNGITYAVGAQMCIGGWLKTCTPANYWKAIGYCKRDDDTGAATPIRFSVPAARGAGTQAGSQAGAPPIRR